MESVFESFLKSGFSFPILQGSGNVPEEIDRLHNFVIGVINHVAPYFKKMPERSLIYLVFVLSEKISVLNTLSG